MLGMRPWLLPYEAAQYMSERLGANFKGAEFLRLGLDGAIQLSVHSPVPVDARICRGGKLTTRTISVEGTWTLLMEGEGKREVECLYAEATQTAAPSIAGKRGARVTREGLTCELPPTDRSNGLFRTRGSALPPEAKIVLSMEALSAFELTCHEMRSAAFREALTPTPAQQPLEDEALLKTRERNTLHTIIVALLSLSKLDDLTATKAAMSIEAETERLGKRVSRRRIEDHVKAARHLIEVPVNEE